jgi:hypothetical protein
MRILGTFFVLSVAAAAAVACSSSSSSANTNCASNPFSCPAGQTCAIKTTLGDFACLPSGPGKKGDACNNTPGAATCSDGLTCFQTKTTGSGSCVSYCDPPGGGSHGCESGEACRAAAIQNTTEQSVFYICAPTTTPDAGADSGGGDSGSGDAATD